MNEHQKPHIKRSITSPLTTPTETLDYFEDRTPPDELFTRRKNLTAHLGVDETVSPQEIQKINTHCLPLPITPPHKEAHTFFELNTR